MLPSFLPPQPHPLGVVTAAIPPALTAGATTVTHILGQRGVL